MEENKQSIYRGIFKGTVIFGGIQVLQIFASIIRGKFSALFIGAVGMGVLSLYTSSLSVVVILSGLGISSSAVRDISLEQGKSQEAFERKVGLIKRLLLLTAILGFFIAFIFSPLLSYSSYGNSDHILSYIYLSAYVLFTILQQGNIAILQGSRHLKKTALAGLLGTFATLICTIPIYYVWGVNGIEFSLILCSFCSFLITHYLVSTLKFNRVTMSFRDTLKEGKSIVSLGMALVLSVFIGTISTYLINLSIRKIGDVNDVGLYQAAIGITTQALSLVFSSMAADYYPKLVQIISNRVDRNRIVNSQIEIVLLLALPILMILVIFSPIIIYLLLSPEFYEISNFIRWVAVGMFFQAMCFPIGYISFAKGDKKVYFLLEGVWSNILQISLKIAGYYIGGLNGLAISFAINGVLNVVVLLFFMYKIYGYTLVKSTIKVILLTLFLLLCAFCGTIIPDKYLMYISELLLLLITVIYSLKALNDRIGFIPMIYKKYGK